MAAHMALVASYAISVVAQAGWDDGCPSPHQVTDALNARVPAVLSPRGQPAGASALRLGVTSATGGSARVQLTDATGEVVLFRALPGPPRGHAADCPALADTVALIVERYLHDVGYEAPPLPPPTLPPPPPPAPAAAVRAAPREPPPPPVIPAAAAGPVRVAWQWQIGIGLEGRFGDTRSLDGAGVLVVGVDAETGPRRAGVRIAVGMAPADSARWAQDQGSLRRVPLRLGGYLAIPAGPGRVEPAVDIGADLLIVSVASDTQASSARGIHSAPFVDVALGYALPVWRHVFVRAAARSGAAVPYRFLAAPEGTVVWSTPRAYLEFGVESGVSFP